MSAESRRRADRLLEQFRLSDRANASVYALSGGMAQRLMVARAIMHRPAVLFLDEPTAGLDPQSRLALWDVIGELHADGRRSCSPRTTWKRPTSSATGSRSSTTGSCSRSTRPQRSRVGRRRHDVTRQGGGDLAARRGCSSKLWPGVDAARVIDRGVSSTSRVPIGSSQPSSQPRTRRIRAHRPVGRPSPLSRRCSSISRGRSCANDDHRRPRARPRRRATDSDRTRADAVDPAASALR